MKILDTSDNLLEFSSKLMNQALCEGAEEAEVFGFAGKVTSVTLRKDKVELCSKSFHQGLGLRTVVKGAVGFSCTSNFDQLSPIVSSAFQSAQVRGHDDAWKSLILPENINHPDNLFDSSLDEIEVGQCIDLANGLLMGSCINGVEPVSGGITCSSIMETIVNSNGVELVEPSTMMNASMEAIAKGFDVATGSEFHNSRCLKSDLEDVGRSAAELAKASLGGIVGESGSFEIILKPLAFMELLESAFIPSLFADNVLKGRSRLAKWVDEPIASENLTIIDDGLLSGGIGSSSFDGEGTPSQKISVVDYGILKSFLYDGYTAGKVGKISTGNAIRSSYSDVPRIGIRNLIVSSKDCSDFTADTKSILVNDLIGAHTANPVSGDFSVEARNAFHLGPNEMYKPIKSIMLAGNIFELLKNIELGKDKRAVGNVVTPSVRVRMNVVS
jgi:PmbA protein